MSGWTEHCGSNAVILDDGDVLTLVVSISAHIRPQTGHTADIRMYTNTHTLRNMNKARKAVRENSSGTEQRGQCD